MSEERQVELRIRNWGLLALVCEEVPSRPGIYFLGAPFNIRYPWSISRIFYIGSSMNLNKKLRSHANTKASGNTLVKCFLSREEELLATYLLHDTNDPDEILALEWAAFFAFGVQYGMVPHGNWILTQPDDPTKYRFDVTIRETGMRGQSLNVFDIAERYDLKMVGGRYNMVSGTERQDKGILIGNIDFVQRPSSRRR